jgi:hypothetical protein
MFARSQQLYGYQVYVTAVCTILYSQDRIPIHIPQLSFIRLSPCPR